MFQDMKIAINGLRAFADVTAHNLFGEEHYQEYLELRGRIDDLEYDLKDVEAKLYPTLLTLQDIFDMESDAPVVIEYYPGTVMNDATLSKIRELITYNPTNTNKLAIATYGKSWRVWLKPSVIIQDEPSSQQRMAVNWDSGLKLENA